MLPRGPMPMAPVTETIEIPPLIHTRFLRPGIPARCCPRLSMEARVFSRRARRDWAFASNSVSSWLRTISAIKASICRVALEHVQELLGLDDRAIEVGLDCSGMARTAFSIRARSASASSVKSCRTRNRPLM